MPEPRELTVTREIADGAEVSPRARIGEFCVIGPNVRIAAGTVLGRRVTVLGRTVIGRDNHKSTRLQIDNVVNRLTIIVSESLNIFRLFSEAGAERFWIGFKPARHSLLCLVGLYRTCQHTTAAELQ